MRPNLYETFCKGGTGSRIVAWLSVFIVVVGMYMKTGWDWRITGTDWDILFAMLLFICYTAPITGAVALIYNMPKNRLVRMQRKYFITWGAMDEDYRGAEEVVPNCYISEKFSYYVEYTRAGVVPFVFKNKDIVRICPSKMQLDRNTGFLNIYTADGKKVQVTKSMEQMEQIITYYRRKYSHIVYDIP